MSGGFKFSSDFSNTANAKGLWNRVNYQPTTGCWNFAGTKNSKGYGFTSYLGRHVTVHRLSAHLWLKFPLDSKLHVLHRCDNPSCFNPKHLFFGTNRDNHLDLVAKGKHYNQVKTHCKRGHEFTPDNTYRWGKHPNTRGCRTCMKIRQELRGGR